MDDIILEKIWEDETFYEIKLKVKTDKVSISHQMYMNYGELPVLSGKINEFIESRKESIWTDSENVESSSLNLRFNKIDALGNVKIYIAVEDEDYKCRFYLNAYLGNIVNFFN